ncbi:polyphosphate kinase 2 family protein [Lacibacterium aquatile]|uniref:Polyphosphate kinase 2 family protein n=1 Tax=Lacibacterium aquatile TaxID=1168082 RepID=A0ABW5DUH5_9PROT
MAMTPSLETAKKLKAIPDEEAWSLIRDYQKELQLLQQVYLAGGQRAIIALEGWDAAGKGGLIRRIAWAMDPRSLFVWPISAPNEVERRQHYLQRFWERLPLKGQFAIFDRTWYGRVLVERVEGFIEKPTWKRAYGEINDFEKALIDDGVHLIKIFLHVSRKEQHQRFCDRMEDPLKRWKLSTEDIRNRRQWDNYEVAIDEMFEKTSTAIAPWEVIYADDKRAARVAAMRYITRELSKGLDLTLPSLDPEVEKALRAED